MVSGGHSLFNTMGCTKPPLKLVDFDLPREELNTDLFLTLASQHAAEASTNFDNALKNRTAQRLADYGHLFKSDAELFSFCSRRVHNVTFADRPYYNEIWLDLNDEGATFLFFYKTEIKTEFLNGEIVTTIG